VIGRTEVGLNGRRGQVSNLGGVFAANVQGVRNAETNEGNLVADALLFKAVTTPDSGLVPGRRVIAFTNGGGIRNDNIIGPGNLSEKDTIDMLPFDNYVSVINGITALALKDALENAVSRWEGGDGRFLQIANFSFVWDPKEPPTTFATAARTMDDVATAGSRIRRIEHSDGTLIYDATTGVFDGGPFDLVTNSFTAGGGDGYDFAGNNDKDVPGTPALPRTNLPASYQQALLDYIEGPLDGLVGALQYPAGGVGRIVVRFDADGDGDIDLADIELIAAAHNQPALFPFDRRDANGDGRIDVLDARLTAVQCSRARCATN